MTIALVDDQLLSRVLRGERPDGLGRADLYTTGCWYVRLCQAVLGASGRPGVLSGPFADLPADLSERVVALLLELPDEIGLLSLRELGRVFGLLRRRHSLNILGMEALAAATHLGAPVYLSVDSPKLQESLDAEGVRWRVLA